MSRIIVGLILVVGMLGGCSSSSGDATKTKEGDYQTSPQQAPPGRPQ